MFGFLKRLFGTKSQRDIKKLRPYVEEINRICESLTHLSHDGLRGETEKLRGQLQKELQPIEDKIAAARIAVEKEVNMREKTNLFRSLDGLEEEYRTVMDEALTKILPRAFAIVKETARRFKEYPTLVVTANDFDRSMAEEEPYVTMEGGMAHWKNRWMAEGQEIVWDLVHYDVQLMGGIVLHQGKVAEMGTGEGKTLVVTLPAFLNALTKKGVHIVTVNDYLAKRDAQWMAPLFQFHGISIGCIEDTPTHSLERKKTYAKDITYGTHNGFGFDYLYDNMATSAAQQVQRGFHCAFVDEIDSILIDEVSTPLIISGRSSIDNRKIYSSLKPRIKQLYQVQQQLVMKLLKEAKQKIGEGNTTEGGLALFRAYRGLPTYGPLISFLSEKGMKKILADTEGHYREFNNKLMPEADEMLFFTIDQKMNSVDLTDKGLDYLSQKKAENSFFVLPDVATEMAGIEGDTTLGSQEKIDKKRELLQDFSRKSARIHAVNQLLKAYTLYKKNISYVVLESKVKIVDQKTGRLLGGRRYSDGLHEALEAKEDLPIQKPTQTFATITPANQFRMYHKLAGMTGTAITEATEMMETYKLEVVVIPPNKPIIRKDLEDRLYKTDSEKMDAIAQEVKEIQATGRPILLITPSVEVSEQLRRLLNLAPTQVLNAKNHDLEAAIIARAGQVGVITIATQMAGRGTDIKVVPEALTAGGLFVIIVEKHETRRVNNQARGRTGRQGQPGTTLCYLSLEDPLVVHWKQGALGGQVDRIWSKEGEVLTDSMITGIITRVQKAKEHNRFSSRKRALSYDDVLDKQRKAIYQRRERALMGQRVSFDLIHTIYGVIKKLIMREEEENIEGMALSLIELFGGQEVEIKRILADNNRYEAIQAIYRLAIETKRSKEKKVAKILYDNLKKAEEFAYVGLTAQYGKNNLVVQVSIADILETGGQAAIAMLQRRLILHVIDTLWPKHLQHMTAVKSAARNATYENKDPILVYKLEGFNVFKQLLHNIDKMITGFLLTGVVDTERVALKKKKHVEEIDGEFFANKDKEEEEASSPKPIVVEKEIGRNERVTVRYPDGTTKEQVKYKTVAQDVEEGKCTII